MHSRDGDVASDLSELRVLLKSARNDVKRYASQVVRLQQELDRERLKTQQASEHAGAVESRNDSQSELLLLLGGESREEEVESANQRAKSLEKALETLLRVAASDCDVCHCHHLHRNTTTDIVDTVKQLASVKSVMSQQKRTIESLARENAQLRDALEKRPTHRDLARNQWQIDNLEHQLARLKDDQRWFPPERIDVPVFDCAPLDTLSDRISVDKLLSWLHVETKMVVHAGGGSHSTTNRRRFLKEPVECYLVLDSAALEGEPSAGSVVTENEKMRRREQLSRRVGILCSEIVASCCHSVNVYEIAKLPRYVEATYQYAQLVPYLQEFVHRVDGFTKAAAVGQPMRHEASQVNETSSRGFLDSLSSRVQDLVFEVRARREQMKPPGDRALAVVMRCMKLLQADHLADVSSTVEKLLETTRREKAFLRDVREVLGLDITAPRATALALIQQLMKQVGFSDPSTASTKSKSSAKGGITRPPSRRHAR